MANTPVEEFDAIVIGAGQGGGPLATALASSGRKTALIESTHAGGTCINVGCTPTKTMVASARNAYLARRSSDFGVNHGPVTVDQAIVRNRTHAIVDEFRSGSEKGLLEQSGLDYITGVASFTGEKRLTVALNHGGERHVHSDQIVIDTGARPRIPDLPGLSDVPYLTSTTALDLTETPEHLIILGAGPIALEFAQIFRRLGSDVTVINRSERLLPKEDPEISDAMSTLLKEDGITLFHSCQPNSVSRSGHSIRLICDLEGHTRTITGTNLLVATGRTPNTNLLAPGKSGVELDKRGYIPVNTSLETNIPGIFAIGDVNGGPAFTHVSYDDFRILKSNLIDGVNRTTEGRLIPWCIYTDPELGRIGMTEHEARAKGLEVKIASMPMSSVARALEMDESRGLMRAVVDSSSGAILGIAVLGIFGGELMTMVQLAMQGNLTATDLANGIFSHPTLAESLNNLFSQVI